MKKITEPEKKLIEENCRHSAHHSQLHWTTILKHRNVWALMAMYFCNQWANYFFVAWMPVYLQEGRHFSENNMKMITFILFVAGFSGLLIGGFVSDWLLKKKGLKFGRRFMGFCGLGLCGFFILVAGITSNNIVTAVCLILSNTFFSFGVMSSYAVCADIGRNNAGTVTGAMNFCGQMGAFFLAILFGKIVDATGNFNAPLYLLAIVSVTGALLWLVINPAKPLLNEEKTIEIKVSVM
jgi:sugar phosphate permease